MRFRNLGLTAPTGSHKTQEAGRLARYAAYGSTGTGYSAPHSAVVSTQQGAGVGTGGAGGAETGP